MSAQRDSRIDGEADENDPDEHAATSRKRKRPRNPFILDEPAADDDEDKHDAEDYEQEQFDTDYNDYEFIDDD